MHHMPYVIFAMYISKWDKVCILIELIFQKIIGWRRKKFSTIYSPTPFQWGKHVGYVPPFKSIASSGDPLCTTNLSWHSVWEVITCPEAPPVYFLGYFNPAHTFIKLLSWPCLVMPYISHYLRANLENSTVATGLEKVSFSFRSQRKVCQRMLKLPHNCTHLTH